MLIRGFGGSGGERRGAKERRRERRERQNARNDRGGVEPELMHRALPAQNWPAARAA